MLSTRNIMKVFRSVTQEDFEEGLNWYSRAWDLACELDPKDPVRAAAIIAVLSPMKSWEINVRLARHAYAGEPIGTFSDGIRKVNALMAGADPYSVVSGPKVVPFFRSIVDPHNPESVAVDRHAISIAAGHPLTDKEREPYLKGKANKAIAQMYVNAAKIGSKETGMDINPCTMQSITWVSWGKKYRWKRSK